MSFKDKWRTWINSTDDGYVDAADDDFDESFDFTPDGPAEQPVGKTSSFHAGKDKGSSNVVSINGPKPAASSKPRVVFQQIDSFDEVTKVADILKGATSKSLIIFDEIGRGTSTFDGMSIARAVLEYSADKKKLGAKTLFATHYHELTDLENSIAGVKNYNISVKKRGDNITFLRRIVPGCADGSYGIEVAKLAGVPSPVVERAKVILAEIESEGLSVRSEAPSGAETYSGQLSFAAGKGEEIIEKLKNIDINTLTPIEAMQKLYELAAMAEN